MANTCTFIATQLDEHPFIAIICAALIAALTGGLLAFYIDFVYFKRGYDWYFTPAGYRVLGSCMGVSMALILGFLINLKSRKEMNRAHGSSRWANRFEVGRIGDSCGLVIGGVGLAYSKTKRKLKKGFYIFFDGITHVMVFAPTRAGKAVAYAIASLLSWNESAIIFDLKGELYDKTAGSRRANAGRDVPENFWHQVVKKTKWTGHRKGSNVLAFYPSVDPTATDRNGNKKSCGFNPLLYIALGSREEFRDIGNSVEVLIDSTISNSNQSSSAGNHFRDLCRMILRAAIIHTLYSNRLYDKNGRITQEDIRLKRFRYTDGGKPLMTTNGELYPVPCYGEVLSALSRVEGIVRAFLAGEKENVDMHDIFREWFTTNHSNAFADPSLCWWGNQDTHPNIYELASTLLTTNERELGSALNTVRRSLDIFSDPNIHYNTSVNFTNHGDYWGMDEIMDGEKPMSLYLIIPENDMDRLAPLLSLLVSTVVRYHMRNPNKQHKWRLCCLIDEFTAWGRLRFLERSIATSASAGIIFFLIMQNKSLMDTIYGEKNSIYANCRVKIGLATDCEFTGEYFSKKVGERTVAVTNKNRSYHFGKAGTTSVNMSQLKRRLILPDEIARMDILDPDKGKPGEAILLHFNDYPIKCNTPMYFLDELWDEQSKIPPPFDIGIEDDTNGESIEPLFVDAADTTPGELKIEKLSPIASAYTGVHRGAIDFHSVADDSFRRKYNNKVPAEKVITPEELFEKDPPPETDPEQTEIFS